jgi:hypothetical protein
VQLPGKFVGAAVAISAFNLNLTHGGAMDIAVTMDVDTGVAILAQHSALRVFLAAFLLMMEIIRKEQVI